MRLDYKDTKLRKLCENSREASRKLGANSAKKLISRLEDIVAASSIEGLPPVGDPHPLHHDREGQFSIGLAGGNRLVFEPTDQPAPVRESGGIHWGQVTAVTIIFIGDYHD